MPARPRGRGCAADGMGSPRHVATIRGYHRSFRVWSRINRGTPENPGLVLTLECGGSCRGLVYRIAPDRVQEEMSGIWKRVKIYGPREVARTTAAYRPPRSP